MTIISVVGARPNFMKIAPFIKAIANYNLIAKEENQINHILVHTGQHYDDRMSTQFFQALGIPEAELNLGIGSGTHAEQVGTTMIAFEKVLQKIKPDWVVVVGDVNATLACSVTAKKENIKVCHIEAGLRSGDLSMPEEINRLVTDRLADLLLTPDMLSVDNLRREGVKESSIKFVGNIMIDTLEANRHIAESIQLCQIIDDSKLNGQENKILTLTQHFAVLTMHRPSNVDNRLVLTALINFLIEEVSVDTPILWPIHPRAEKQLKAFGLWPKVSNCPNIILLNPLGYHAMLKLNMETTIMLTDSGGLQEECTVLGTPCLTMRWNTERPITLREYGGASVLVGNSVEKIRIAYRNTLSEKRLPKRPELWDGKTAERCLREILEYDKFLK